MTMAMMNFTPDQVECPVCGRQRFRAWIATGRGRAVACVGCQLRMTHPRPSPEELARVYESGDYYESHGMGENPDAAWRERAKGIVSAAGIQPRTLLDVGAGEGHLVHAMRELGIAADGVELFATGRAAARERYGVELRETPPLEASYDLVTWIHSLEHTRDPVAELRRCRELLAPSGRLLVEVPHAGSIEMMRPTVRDKILDFPVHLFHFVPATLSSVVRAAGFVVERVELINPEFLERLLALRRPRAAPGPSVATSGASPRHAMLYGIPRLRRLWSGHVLPMIRSVAPGYEFTLVAKRGT